MDKWTKEYPWRFIQTNLREIDMLDINAKNYVRQLVDFNATIVMINVGGIISSYPTNLSFHFQSPFLKGDSLKEIIEECHKAGIKVMARNDFSKIRREIYEEHPNWGYRTSDGNIIDYNGDVHTCVNDEYQRIYSFKIIKEILNTLDIDGIFFNMGGYRVKDYSYNEYGICHCENCQKLFKEMFNLDLPKNTNMNNPTYRKYLLFKEITLSKYKKQMADFIESINPHIAIDYVDFYRQESNSEFNLPISHWQYSASSNTRWVKSTYPNLRSSNTSVDFIGFFYRHVAVNPAQQELRLWQSLANNGGLDYYLIGRLDNHQDKSGYESIKKVFKFHKDNEKDYTNLTSTADILLVRNIGWGGNEEDRGFVRFLSENHFLFDEILVEGLTISNLNKYKCIILANTKYLSNEIGVILDSFVLQGGVLISVGDSGEYDEKYEKRNINVFNSLGITSQIIKRTDMRSALFKIEDLNNYPTFKKWETSLLYFGDDYFYCTYTQNTKKHLKLIPPHHFGPPERCYYSHITNLPGYTINPFGKGKGVHIPWLPGTLFCNEGYVNTNAFINDLLKNILDLPYIKTTASPMIEFTLSKGENYHILHLVNTSGHFSNTFYEPMKTCNISIEMRYDKKPIECISLVTKKALSFTYNNNTLKLNLNHLEAFEAIKII